MIEEERVVESFRVGVLDWDGAIDSVPAGANELRLDRFGYVDCAVAVDGDLFVEALNDDLFRRGGKSGQEGEDAECEKAAGSSLSAPKGRFEI